MSSEWYYGHDGERHGPVPLADLKQLAASNQLEPTDLVWTSGMPDWLPAKDIEDLFPQQELAHEPAAEPLPPVTAPAISSARSATTPSNSRPLGEAPALWNPQAVGIWSVAISWVVGAASVGTRPVFLGAWTFSVLVTGEPLETKRGLSGR